MAESLPIRGLPEARSMFRELARDDEDGAKTIKGIVRRGITAGAKVLRKAERNEAPVLTGQLRRAIKVKRSSRKGMIRASVGASAQDFGQAFYGAFLAWGHYAGPRKLGSKRKHVPGDDFIGRAYAKAKEPAAAAAAAKILEGVADATT